MADLDGRVKADRDLLQEDIICAQVEAPASTAAASSRNGHERHRRASRAMFLLEAASEASHPEELTRT